MTINILSNIYIYITINVIDILQLPNKLILELFFSDWWYINL